ncbi:MAG: LysR family transcriptional regulator [Bdellovibrionaceae bacterium]|nr:LysR family transcriptional regulator [Pseudobdellovibrionaceae bacterium]
MEWLNYHHLYYFRTIATEGGVARAAEKLRLGQPTLSTQLKQLEDSLGTPLFERRNRRLVLTEAGHIALQYANEIFRMGDEMREALHDRLPTSRLHVQIGALDSVPKSLVLQLTQFAYQAGDCVVSILEGKSDELFRELLTHRLDVVIANFPPTLGEDIKVHSRTIAKVPVVVCGASRFKNLAPKFPNSLNGQPFVMPTLHSKLRHDLEHYLRTHGIRVDAIAETQDTALQSLLGEAGVGLVPMAAPAAEDLIRQKKLYRIGTIDGVFEELWLIAASRKIENPIAARIMKSFSIS